VLGPAWVLALLLPDSAVAREAFSKGQPMGVTTRVNVTEGSPKPRG